MSDAVWTPKGSGKSSEDVFCICRKPYNGEWMIVCEKCDDWFHGTCVKLQEDQGNLAIKFYCPNCSTKYGLVSLWKPKCRLSSCWQAAQVEQGSKYCSAEHGILFFREMSSRVHGVSKNELATILKQVKTPDELHELGTETPKELDATPEAPNPSQDEIDQLESEVAELELRKKYIGLAFERKKALSLALQQQTDKKKDICAMDQHLINDPAYIHEHANDAQLEDNDSVCHNEQQKCLRHAYWWTLMGDQTSLRISEARRRIAKLTQDYHGEFRGRIKNELANKLYQESKVRV